MKFSASGFVFLFVFLFCLSASHARRFESLDPIVRGVIADCQVQISTAATYPGESKCQPFLYCILNNVDAATAARWSAGASILAFIPTLAALMSNSIDEVVLTAEESLISALALAFCSITLFTARFRDERARPEAINATKESLSLRIEAAFEVGPRLRQYRERQRRALLGALVVTLLGGCVALWWPVTWIARYGVVVFSCEMDGLFELWIALAQAVAVLNVLARKKMFETRSISLDGDSLARSCTRHPWPSSIILRHPRHTPLSYAIRVFTSLLSLALYAFATGVLGGMTMYPASNAIAAMAMFAAVAGLGRIVCQTVFAPFAPWRASLVVDVPEGCLTIVHDFVQSEIQKMYQ